MLKYRVITFGCQMNKADSERIAAVLEKRGYKLAGKESEADLILVNMCSVRQAAVDRVFGKIKNLGEIKTKNKKLKIVLTGCIAKEDRKKFYSKFDEIIDKEKLLNPKRVFLFRKLSYGNIAYIPISNGCNNACAYCVVPQTRGKLACRSHKIVLKEIKSALKKGAKEIWLLGQSVNDYQSPADSMVGFAELFKMANDIDGDFKIFFTSPHPKNFTPKAIETLAECEKFGKDINLPIQSGDDKILSRMNRPYKVKDYKKIVEEIRKKIPGIKLSTDIIVGFPGETKKQFQNTVKLAKEMNFDWAYISKYSPRNGTTAFKMKNNVSVKEKQRRWKILDDLVNKK